jgi:hypothetical protein
MCISHLTQLRVALRQMPGQALKVRVHAALRLRARGQEFLLQALRDIEHLSTWGRSVCVYVVDDEMDTVELSNDFVCLNG